MKNGDWRSIYKDKIVTSTQASQAIVSNDAIVTSEIYGIPYAFLQSLFLRGQELTNVRIYTAWVTQQLKGYNSTLNGHIDLYSEFMGPCERQYVSEGCNLSYIPVHYSDWTRSIMYMGEGRVVAAVGTPPDEEGMISFGPCPVDVDLIDGSRLVIVQVNEHMPYVYGEGVRIPAEKVDMIIDYSEKLPVSPPKKDEHIDPLDKKIGEFILDRIPDGACIQLGVGKLGSAIGQMLRSKKHLGIHSEMFSSEMIDLIICGAVDNSMKNVCPGISVYGFAAGTQKILDFVDGNKALACRPFSWVNDPRVIAKIDNFVSVNSALQVDLTGQVCAESFGPRQYSGSGGQSDFVRGAKWSKGGLSFIALPSTRTDKGGRLISKISCVLPAGSAVTTTRTDVQFIVTEYGVADLRNEPICERVRKLIAIAHPYFREQLLMDARKAGLLI